MSEQHAEVGVKGEVDSSSIVEAAAMRQQEVLNSREKGAAERLSETAERANVEIILGNSNELSPSERKKTNMDNQAPSLKQAARQVSSREKNESYNQTLRHIRTEMTRRERVMSSVIHNPVVEKTSEVIGSTVARPNAILAGSFSAFILTMIVYVVARNMGYTLSGTESIAAFIFGWSLGLVYDYVRIMIAGKAS